MAGIYRRFVFNSIAPATAKALKSKLADTTLNQAGIGIYQLSYDIKNQILIFSVGIDPEDLISIGITATTLRNRILSFYQTWASKLPDIDVAVSFGDDCKTKRDRQRELGKL